MDKAEKFIQDYTRNCSNELCAVEDKFGKKVISYHEWLTPDQARSAVEIAREELLEKVCSFIDDNMAEYVDIRGYTGTAFIDIRSDRLITDIKQSLEDGVVQEKKKYLSWNDMSEEEKAEFFKSDPFKIKKDE